MNLVSLSSSQWSLEVLHNMVPISRDALLSDLLDRMEWARFTPFGRDDK